MRRFGRAPVSWLGLLVGLAGCGGSDTDWRWPEQRPEGVVRVERLVERVPRIEGTPSGGEATLARWHAADLAGWTRQAVPEGLHITSPPLGGLAGVGRVDLALATGGAERLELLPTVEGDDPSMRRLRGVEVPLEQNLPPDTVLRLHADLHEAIHGNWADSAREGRLMRLELLLSGGDPAAAGLRELTLRRHDAPSEPFAARVAIAEREGRLHPSWWVRGGCAAEFELEVPGASEAPALLWYEAALGDAATSRIDLLDGGESVSLDRSPLGTEGARRWRPRRVSLAAWAGRRVRIRLSAAGPGVGLFGDPRVVATAGVERRRDVLVYLIDTLRADHVGAFGARYPDITPTLDRLVSEGVAFTTALSHSPWTKPSVATLQTGLLATTHRIGSRTLSDRLPEAVPLVQERFRDAGWRTGSFSASPLGSTLSGLERGFGTAIAPRHFSGRAELGSHPSGPQVHAELLRWIDEEPERGFFAYVHVMEVHPEGFSQRSRPIPPGYSHYAAAVQAADRDLAALLRALAERGRLEDLLLVVLADHGESFGAHGRHMAGHGTSLFQEQIHVPLVFWSRSGPRERTLTQPVGLADVAPTLLELVGLPPIEDADGRSLAAQLAGGEAAPRPIASALLRFPHRSAAPQQFSLVAPDGTKVIQVAGGRSFLFDLQTDPHETGRARIRKQGLEEELRQRVASYAERARAFEQRYGAADTGTVDPEELKRLRALGYVP